MHRRIPAIVALIVMSALPSAAQESQFQADLRRERQHIAESCAPFAVKAMAGCVIELATDEPLHVAIGSLPPQNGFGFGAAFVEHYTPNENWRLSWNADAVGTPGGSWRAGAYMKIIRTARAPITVVSNPGSQSTPPAVTIREYPVVNVYAQAISLKNIFFFGLGPSTGRNAKSIYGEQQTIVGTNAIVPLSTPAVFRSLRASLIAGLNGRFVMIRGGASTSAPSIRDLYDDRSAPGLGTQPAVAELNEGIRFKPSWLNGSVRPNYLVSFQQFLAGGGSHSSFHRWTVDLGHEVPLYKSARSSGPRETNGPDECAQALGSDRCPSISRNREGTVGFRFLVTSSSPFDGNVVPFYFQPTLGGSDLNGNRLLPSYEDYRFRGPHLLALQETFEHSIWGPIGFWFLADQGKVALDRGDLSFSGLAHSFAAGLTLRAGGFPVVNLAFAWGGPEGHHILATMDPSLLGGSSRPSLY